MAIAPAAPAALPAAAAMPAIPSITDAPPADEGAATDDSTAGAVAVPVDQER
jgi:hypothetical protein